MYGAGLILVFKDSFDSDGLMFKFHFCILNYRMELGKRLTKFKALIIVDCINQPDLTLSESICSSDDACVMWWHGTEA